jgi:trehalose 6-phosphate phosphatase
MWTAMNSAADLPAPPSLSELSVRGPVALFLDFDGTLVEIAETPGAIDVPHRLAERLCALSERLDGRLALVSGRAVANLEEHCGPLGVACAGSHGLSRFSAARERLGEEPRVLPAPVLDLLDEFAAAEGFRLETKAHGAALHYRSDPSLETRGLAFATALAGEHGLVIKRGKCVIELVPPGGDKGSAVGAFMQEQPFAGALPVFVGDDVTDEDGFAAVQELGGFGVLVGKRSPSAARYGLADPAAVQQWLEL